MHTDIHARPPIGFVVEGLTEYQAYPSFVARCLDGVALHVPLSNARGNGRLCTELEEHLDDIVKTHHPYVVVVTLDAREAIREGRFATCIDLKVAIQHRCDQWLESEKRRARFHPLPERVVAVIQHPAFEGWLIADINGLASASEVVVGVDTSKDWDNVDDEIANPGAWIDRFVRPGVKFKPTGAVTISKALDVAVVEGKSRSFRKLAKEIRAAYHDWGLVCGFVP